MERRTYRFTIQRPGEADFERTVVGRTGQRNVDRTTRKGTDGHYTHEGEYRLAIERAVRANQG